MPSAKREFRDFINCEFKGLQLKRPLFYNWDVALRFNLQVGLTDTDEYFEQVLARASVIFQTVFDKSDNVFVAFVDNRFRRKKIRFQNYVFKQVAGLRRSDVYYSRTTGIYEANNISNIALFRTSVEKLNYTDIMAAIGNVDFHLRSPRLDRNGVFSSKEIYFVNIDRSIVFNMYDDRGLDVIAADKETLKPIYMKLNSWLLENDRARMKQQFE